MDKLRHRFTAGMMLKDCGGTLAAGRRRQGACGISTDSRTIEKGEAFLALVGPNHDGHDFVPQAIEAGASIVVAMRRDEQWRLPRNVALILVGDTTRALVRLAAMHRRRLRGKVLSVTGSCGKSTVKTMLGAILSRAGRCGIAQRSFNNRIGLSLSLLDSEVEDDFTVLEMGTNHPGEIDELARCAKPHAGIITCIGECHLEGLGDRIGVMEAKAELIPHLDPDGVLILNADDPLCASLGARFAGEVRTFGFSGRADVRPINLRRDSGAMAFEACGESFRLPAAGRHNALNAAAAICASMWAGATLEQAREALAQVALPPMRFEKRQLAGVTFILDCYNSNPTAMHAALRGFLDEPVARRRMVVCGDMLEMGDAAQEMHRHLGRTLALTHVDILVAVGPLGRFVLDGWAELAQDQQVALHFPTAQEAWRPVWALTAPGDAVLIKGSRAMKMETVASAIAEHIGLAGKEAAA